MKIVIAYLYYDLLNLYGESGNLKSLKLHLESQGIEPTIKFLTTGDELEFDKYDLVLMSAGTEHNQRIALKHLLKYRDKIKKAIEGNKYFLITGNSIDLFGKYILTKDKRKIKCLDIFDYHVEESEKRIVNDALSLDRDTNEYVLGFQNQSSIMIGGKNPLFDVIVGNEHSSKEEGIHYKNFYGTYLIGPLLVRNPSFEEKFIKDLISSIDKNFKFKPFDFEFEIEAYDKYFNLHYNQIPKIKSTN